MGSVYSVRFLAASNPPSTVQFECPPDYRAVLRWICVNKAAEPSGGELDCSIGGVATFFTFSAGTGSSLADSVEFRVVFNAGEYLQLFPRVGNWSFVASGYLLSLP